MDKDEKRNPLSYLFSKTWQYSEGNRKKIVWYWIMFIVANSIEMFFPPFILAAIMGTIEKEGITSSNLKYLWGLLALTLVVELVFWAIHAPARCIERNNAFAVRRNYRQFLLQGVMTLPLEWHTEHHSGDTIDKIEKGTTALFSFSEDSFEVIYAVVQLVVSYAVLAYFSHPAALIVLGMIVVSFWLTIQFDKIMIGQYKELNHLENQISESVFDAVSNISTVIILRVEKLVFRAIMGRVEKPFDLFQRNQRLNELKWCLTSLCCTVMTIIVLGVYFWQNLNSSPGVLVASLFILIRYLERISDLFFKFTGRYGDILKYKSRILNAGELSQDFRVENFSNHVLPKNWRTLNVSNLSFSYHNEDDPELHLNNVSFEARRGEKIALVGETGSGKTTFLKVMRDLYHPQELRLSVDGEEIPSGFEGINRAISLVPQDPEIFASTILANITMGAEHDLAFVRHFTDVARFSEVVDGLPKGFDSSTREKGVNLSGGQQQRLALSRGLLACHDKDIVLLDEPTSSLDTVTEVIVYQNIFQEFSGKTVISTVHQLHLLPLFDRICVFDKGQIIAAGTISELLLSCPKFVSLWEAMQRARTEVE
ncbi:MAG: ABC transporter ATP-binding protein [Candidatus Paceibacterota bacterium]|jgi:ABC-type multidrug transport system fused ATPase/permease subunit